MSARHRRGAAPPSQAGRPSPALLEGKVAVITGVGPGIGRATAIALAVHGADVALGARRPEMLEAVASEVRALGRRAVWRPTNIVDPHQCAALAEEATTLTGRIDVVVQNAFMHGPFGTVEAADPEDWRRTYKVNVIGTLLAVRACLPHMGPGSAVVITSSMAARTSDPEPPGSGAYAASKTAQLSLARSLTHELGPRGIRVNTVLPGWVLGDSLDMYFRWKAQQTGRTPDEIHDEIAAQAALRRLVTPEDVAGTIVFLASDLARGITGQQIDVNAGHWLP